MKREAGILIVSSVSAAAAVLCAITLATARPANPERTPIVQALEAPTGRISGTDPATLWVSPYASSLHVLLVQAEQPAAAPGEPCVILGESTVTIERPAPKSTSPRAPTPAGVRRLEEDVDPGPAKVTERWYRVRCGMTEGWTTRVELIPSPPL